MAVTTTVIDTAKERATRLAALATRYAEGSYQLLCIPCKSTPGGCADHLGFATQLRDAAESFEQDVRQLEAEAAAQGGAKKGRKGRVNGGRLDLARVTELFGLSAEQVKDAEDEQSAMEFRAELRAAERKEAAACGVCARNGERYGIQGCNRHRVA